MKEGSPGIRSFRRYFILTVGLIILFIIIFYTTQAATIVDGARTSIEETSENQFNGESSAGPATIIWVSQGEGSYPHGYLPDQNRPCQGALAVVAESYRQAHAQWPTGEMRLIESDDSSFWVAPGEPFSRLTTNQTIPLYAADCSLAYQVLRRSTTVMAMVGTVGACALRCLGHSALRKLAQAEERSKTFFANASHELKTPLMAIEGSSAELQEGLSSVEESAPRIEREVMRMKGLVDDILALSKVDGGAVRPVAEPMDLRETLYEALDDVGPAAREHGVEIAPSVAGQQPLVSDPRLLASIVSNMATNAVRHADSSVQATIESDRGRLKLAVTNDGAPLSPDDLAHAFDRFHAGPGGQTGIGLALAREYATLLGATLELASDETGTTCTLTLPTKAP